MYKIIKSKKSPSPNGHYSQGIAFNNLIFTAAQLPSIELNKENIEDAIQEQTNSLLNNLLNIVIDGGGEKSTILKVTIYVTDMQFWPIINEEYSKFMNTNRPVRSVVNVKEIHKGYFVMGEVIAHVRSTD